MSINVTIDINREFDVAAGIEDTFALLSNVPESASHFPKVDQLVDLGDNSFRWEMEKIGVDKHALQTIYACVYEANEADKSIVWTPVKGVGNGIVEGHWKMEPNDAGGTRLKFYTKGVMTLPLPSLLKLAVSPVVKHEFNALVDTYTKNLQQALA